MLSIRGLVRSPDSEVGDNGDAGVDKRVTRFLAEKDCWSCGPFLAAAFLASPNAICHCAAVETSRRERYPGKITSSPIEFVRRDDGARALTAMSACRWVRLLASLHLVQQQHAAIPVRIPRCIGTMHKIAGPEFVGQSVTGRVDIGTDPGHSEERERPTKLLVYD